MIAAQTELQKFSGALSSWVHPVCHRLVCHRLVRARKITAAGVKDKTAVVGVLERGGNVRTIVVKGRKKPEIQAAVRKYVQAGSALYKDALRSYDGMNEFEHKVIDHAVAYVDARIHTNGLENFWSLLKRGIKGTYVSVEPFHLFRYLDEQSFRYKNRKEIGDQGRFELGMKHVADRRLTYRELTGKEPFGVGASTSH